MSAATLSRRLPLPGVLALLLGACVTMAWGQNRGWLTGGAISPAKTLWLNLALAVFYVIPAALWRDERLEPPARRLFGWVLLGFAMRASVELPVLYFTHAWRCGYGIAHDAAMLGVIVALGMNLEGRKAGRGARETKASSPFLSPCLPNPSPAWAFLPLLAVALVAEGLNAWLFSRIADPGQGIYFAADSAPFRRVNQLTWVEIALLYPWLALWLRRYFRPS